MDDLIEFHAAEQIVERGAVAQIAVDEFKRFGSPRGTGLVIPWGKHLDIVEVSAFEFRVVEIVEVIERPDRMAVAQETFTNMRANEARAAGDQKIHAQTLTTGGRTVERAAFCALTMVPGKTMLCAQFASPALERIFSPRKGCELR